jgi:hypothetical protein
MTDSEEIEVPQMLMDELRRELSAEDIQRGLRYLHIRGLSFDSRAADQRALQRDFEGILAAADKGRLPLIETPGGDFLTIASVRWLVSIASRCPGSRTMGEILDAYPGVDAASVPKVHVR